jgi:hypothetical protein
VALTKMMRAIAALALFAGATTANAQQPAAAATPAPAPAAAAAPKQPTPEPKLVFDREVYAYASNARRDPFKPLAGKESLGPLFEDLKLRGIIYSPEPTLSIVLMQDGSRRLYRLHRGEVVGNSRIVEIKPLMVRFAVENFGMIKYETLELRSSGVYARTPEPKPAEAQTAAAIDSVKKPPLPPRVDFPSNNPARSVQLIDSIAKDAREKRVQSQKNNTQSETPR